MNINIVHVLQNLIHAWDVSPMLLVTIAFYFVLHTLKKPFFLHNGWVWVWTGVFVH